MVLFIIDCPVCQRADYMVILYVCFLSGIQKIYCSHLSPLQCIRYTVDFECLPMYNLLNMKAC